MNDPFESSEPDHKAFLGEDDVPDFDLYRDEILPELPLLPGDEFSVSESPRDQFITGTARGEMRTTADLARFLPAEDLATLKSVSHPVKDVFLDPYLNSNIAHRNLELIYRQWQDQEPNADLRKLAFMIAAISIATAQTFQCIAPDLGKEDWNHENVQAGFWKRGFTSLEGKDDYLQMSREIGLDLIRFPSLVNVPTIAAHIMGIGMFQTGFTPGKTLSDYFNRKVENWEGASEILGRKDGGKTGLLAQEVMADIRVFLWSKEKNEGMKMTDYLIHKGRSQAFAKVQCACAVRMLKVLGFLPMNIPRPEDENETEPVKFRYENEKGGFGTPSEMTKFPADASLHKFQLHANKRFRLAPLLPEKGELDPATFRILMSGGHQVLSGNITIHCGFDQKLPPVNPVKKAFRDNREGNLGLVQLSRLLLQYLPLEQPMKVISYISQLTAGEAHRFSFEIIRQSTSSQMGMIENEVLEALRDNLLNAAIEEWKPQIDRITRFLD